MNGAINIIGSGLEGNGGDHFVLSLRFYRIEETACSVYFGHFGGKHQVLRIDHLRIWFSTIGLPSIATF